MRKPSGFGLALAALLCASCEYIATPCYTLQQLTCVPDPTLVVGQESLNHVSARDEQLHRYGKREWDYETFTRVRNAHACIMSIVFIVLFPLGAISIHLPIDQMPFLRNTYLVKKVMAIHVPIQAIGFAMMVGAMGLGISMARFLDFFNEPIPHARAHTVIGLVVCCVLILFQPAMGFIQHRHFRKTGGKSVFAYAHRWTGRCAIILGMINTGLGFQLASSNIIVPTSSYIRNYVLLGVFVLVWLGLIVFDQFKPSRSRSLADGGEKGSFDDSKARSGNSPGSRGEAFPNGGIGTARDDPGN